MIKLQKTSSFLGLGSFALGLCLALPAAATSVSGVSSAAPGDTVSAVGVPSGPNDTVVAVPNAVSSPLPAESQPSAPPSFVAEQPADIAPPPADTSLAAPAEPAATLSVTPLPGEDSGQSNATSVMGDTGARPKHSGTYYDPAAVLPDKRLSDSPRKVDPAVEPGQKFVVVTKTGSATSFEGQYIAASRALKLGRYAAAMEMFGKLYKQNPKDARILMGLALSQQSAGFNESAIRTYEDLLGVEPNNPSAIINLMGLMKNQYPSVTLTKLMELRGKYPDNPGIPAQIGLVNAELRNYDDAIRYLDVAASMEPFNPDHIYNMAIIADRKGDAQKAIQYYERALQVDASAAVNSNAVDALPREKIYDRLAILRRKV